MTLFRSMYDFQKIIRTQIINGELNSALINIHRIVDQVFCEPINTTQIFGSKLLDDLCQEIGSINLKNIYKKPPLESNNSLKTRVISKVTVYIASKLQPSGGHTAALADIIRLSPPAKSVVLITGIGGATDHAAIQHRFSSIPNITFEYAPLCNHIEKLGWLQSRLLELSPKDVWLFNHHQDSTAVAAVQPNAGYKLRYYHHGDHHLCLGVYLNYAEHIDPHPMGYYSCRNDLRIPDNRYLPLVVSDLGSRPNPVNSTSKAELVTLTAAGSNKVEVPYFIRYIDVIPKLLRASGGRHIHVGRLSPVALRQIRRGMQRLGLAESAFVHIPFVSSVWRTLHEHQVDLYIASFPYGGARTLIEAMGAGIPLAIHSHCSSRALGTFDMAYKEAFVWRNPDELYSYFQSVTATTLKEHGRLSRKRFEECYKEEILKDTLRSDTRIQPPALHEGYWPDDLQQALDITNQVSILGAMRRIFYRNYRKWRR